MTYEELCTKIGSLHEENSAIVARVNDAGKADEWPSDEKEKFDKTFAEIRRLGESKKRYDQHKAVDADLIGKGERQTEANELRARQASKPPLPTATDEDADFALRAWMQTQLGAQQSQNVKPEWRAAATKLGVDVHALEFPFKLARLAPRSARHEDMQKWEARALTVTTTAGGYLISPEMNRALEEARLFYGGMLSVSTVIRTDTGAVLPFPTFNGTATKGRILGINTQATQTDPVFGVMNLGAFKYSSDLVLVPEELLQDSGINISDFLGRALGERIGRILNEHFTTGTGTTLPWGAVVRATAVNLGAGTAGGFGSATDGTAYRNFLKLVYGVDIAYRQNATIMMNDLIVQNLAGLTDANGRPLWTPGLVAGSPDRFMGYPIVINNDMTGVFANLARTILFGDFSKYYIREVRDVAILSSRERFIDFHQTAFLGFGRYDGDLLNAGTGPIKALVHQT